MEARNVLSSFLGMMHQFKNSLDIDRLNDME
jgi:hypothetical protein